jgi:hypothetical protein
MLELSQRCSPDLVRVSSGLWAQAQVRRRGLHDLEKLVSWTAIGEGTERQRRNGNRLAALGKKGKQVGGAALHADGGQRIAAGTRIRPLQDTVVEIVVQDWLYPVGKVAQKDRMRRFTWRGRPKVRADRLEHNPVGVDVQPSVPAALAQERALGGGVAVADSGAESLGDLVVLACWQALGRECQQDWT